MLNTSLEKNSIGFKLKFRIIIKYFTNRELNNNEKFRQK